MFLKSIEIFGFKSFADRSRLDFSEGITALLGPNGCGKSNVVDALKWVLGEQATKSLRADKMEDVIFNGTEHRKPLNVAEVTLTLSNDEGILDLDVSEIAVKRRLYRSGESEYFINNVPVKLKEVRELFFDTGVGKVSYSIMEQGKIDQILSSKPEERRYIFEEAAGITKYKIRGQEAERKLEKTEENLRQVENILSEVKRSHDSLAAQAERTRRFRDLKSEIVLLEKTQTHLRHQAFLEDQTALHHKLEARRRERDEARQAVDQLNQSVEKNLDEVNGLEARLVEVQKQLYGLEVQRQTLEGQLSLLRDRLGHLDQQSASSEAKKRSLLERLEQLAAEALEKEGQIQALQSQLKTEALRRAEFEANIQQAADRIASNEEAAVRDEAEIQAQEAERSQLQTRWRDVTDRLVEELDRALKEEGISWQDVDIRENALQEQLGSLKALVQGRGAHFEDLTLTGPPKDWEAWLKAQRSFFLDLRQQVDSLQDAAVALGRSVPRFLAGFLAPEGVLTQKRELEDGLAACDGRLEVLRSDIRKRQEENQILLQKREEYRRTLEDVKVQEARLAAQGEAAQEALSRLRADQGHQQVLLVETERDLADLARRRQDLDAQRAQVDLQKAEGLRQEEAYKGTVRELEAGIAAHNQALAGTEKEIRARTEGLNQSQAQLEALQIQAAGLATEIRNLAEHFRERHGLGLEDLAAEAASLPLDKPLGELRELLSQKRDQQRALGQVNLMALDEYNEVKQRYEFLLGQIADLTKAREDLRIITKEIQRESTVLLEDTFGAIQKNFQNTFKRLFGGGRAELRLTDPANILESGIELFCQPPGKKLESIALLSGGERSLTAVGLLFATYLVKPSPFCLLDEIDAALDEANVGRFVNLLMEFGQSSQFIVITHNKKTVAGARAMIGVTMEESGVSKVIAVRLDQQAGSGGLK